MHAPRRSAPPLTQRVELLTLLPVLRHQSNMTRIKIRTLSRASALEIDSQVSSPLPFPPYPLQRPCVRRSFVRRAAHYKMSASVFYALFIVEFYAPTPKERQPAHVPRQNTSSYICTYIYVNVCVCVCVSELHWYRVI